ncbi:MAG: VCBS repeat-containing protein [Planctomycetota bacterium]
MRDHRGFGLLAAVAWLMFLSGLICSTAVAQPTQFRLNEVSFSAKPPARAVDLDNDGLIDVVAADNETGISVRLVWLRNLGGSPPAFEEIPLTNQTSNGQTIRSLDIGDLDGDGDMDIAFFGQTSGVISRGLYWIEHTEDPPGLWPRRQLEDSDVDTSFASVGAVLDIEIHDVNADGLNDITALYRPQLSSSNFQEGFAWWQNDGNPTGPPSFDLESFVSMSTGPETFDVADLNGDGKPDVVTGTFGPTSPIRYLVQTPESTPQNVQWLQRSVFFPANPAIRGYIDGIDAIDLTNDGIPELIGRFAGFGNGDLLTIWSLSAEDPVTNQLTYTPSPISPSPNFIATPRAVAAFDIDGDNDVDLVVNDGRTLLRNDGFPANPFTVIDLNPAEGATATETQPADLDNDGDTDILITGGSGAPLEWLEQSIVRNVTTGQLFPSLPLAITAAASGETIEADPGAFGEPALDLESKALTLRSLGDVRSSPGQSLTLADSSRVEAVVDAVIDLAGAVSVPDNAAATLSAPNIVLRSAPTAGSNATLTIDAPQASLAPTSQFLRRSIVDRIETVSGADARTPLVVRDLNNDGLPDFAYTPTFGVTEEVRLYESRADDPGGFVESILPIGDDDFPQVEFLDIDQDGLRDLLVARFFDNTLEWYPNLGSAGVGLPSTFGAPQLIADNLSFSGAIALGDLNGDGLDDVTGGGVYALTQPDGSLVLGSVALTGDDLEIADLNGDGAAEIIGVNVQSNNTVRIAWNDGDPSAPMFTVEFLNGPVGFDFKTFAVGATDYDLDGDQDIIINDINRDDLLMFRNDGLDPPSFELLTLAEDVSRERLVLIDIDGDGDTDALVENSTNPSLIGPATVLRNDLTDPPSAVAVPITTPDAAGIRSFGSADFDGDGEIDVVSVGQQDCTEEADILMGESCIRIDLYRGLGRLAADLRPSATLTFTGDARLNRGALRVSPGATLGASTLTALDESAPGPDSVTVSGQGLIDAAFENAGVIELAPNATLTVTGPLDQAATTSGGQLRTGRIATPFDETIASQAALSVSTDAHLGGALVVTPGAGFAPAPGSVTYELITAGGAVNGVFDAVVVSPALPGDRFVQVSYASSARSGEAARRPGSVILSVGTLDSAIDLDDPQGFSLAGIPTDADIADLNGDGFEDLAVSAPDALDPVNNIGSLTILFSDGAGGFASQLTYPVGRNPQGVAIGDLDGAGGLDIAVTAAEDDTVVLFRNDNLGLLTSFVPSTPITQADIATLDEPLGVVITQADGAGAEDVAFVAANTGRLVILENLAFGPGTLTFDPCDIPVGPRPKDLDDGDVDADAAIDFVVGSDSPGAPAIVVVRNTGPAAYATTTIPLSAAPEELRLIPLDGDALPEIVAVIPDADAIALLRNLAATPGVFAPPADLPVGDNPTSITAFDADVDPAMDLDLALVASDSNGVRVVQILRNDTSVTGQPVFALSDELASGAEPGLVRSGDLNNDGRDDLVTLDAASPGPAPLLARTPQDAGAVLLNPVPPCSAADVTIDGTCLPGVYDGLVTLSDFACYLSDWANDEPRADITQSGMCMVGSGGDGVDLSDFSCYVSEWSQGCAQAPLRPGPQAIRSPGIWSERHAGSAALGSYPLR